MIERPIVYKRAIEMFAAIREVVGDEVLRPSLVFIIHTVCFHTICNSETMHD